MNIELNNSNSLSSIGLAEESGQRIPPDDILLDHQYYFGKYD